MENLIEIKNLSKVFNQDKPSEVYAVKDVSFNLGSSETLLIMGPSGSGKTTLLTMIGGLLRSTSGEITMSGKNISRSNPGALSSFRRENIGFIFQSFNLLKNLSALENVQIAAFKQKEAKKKAKELLERLGLKDRMDFKPNDLSGGERQRVAIARALINNPRLILADEPTANLDKSIGHEVTKLLCSIACEQGKGVIIVSHDERIKDTVHRIIHIEDGKLVKEEKGGHDKTCEMRH